MLSPKIRRVNKCPEASLIPFSISWDVISKTEDSWVIVENMVLTRAPKKRKHKCWVRQTPKRLSCYFQHKKVTLILFPSLLLVSLTLFLLSQFHDALIVFAAWEMNLNYKKWHSKFMAFYLEPHF